MGFREQLLRAGGWAIVSSTVLVGTLTSAAEAVSAEWSEARALLDSGKADEAYRLLSGHEAEAAGDEEFDYLLGMAAVDSGHASDAVFSLERVVAIDPTFLGARMELARAQFDSGDAPGARAQFQYLLAQSPPTATRDVIQRYLDALNHRGAAAQSELRTYVDLGAGYDSNANGATGSDQFLGFTLDPHSVEASSGFLDLAAGLNHGHGFANGSTLLSSVRLSHRFNPEADFIDLSIASLGTRLLWSWGGTRLDFGVNGDFDWLDGKSHQSDGGIGLGIAHRLAGNWDIRFDARALALRFQQDELEVLDADRWLGSVNLERSGGDRHQSRFGFVLLAGEDNAKQSASPYDNERWGARVYTSWSMTERSTAYAEVAYLVTDYADSPGFFGADRKDKQWSAVLATEYQNWPARGWSLAPRIRYVKNDCDIALYEFDRVEAGVFLRRNFR